MGGDGYSVEGDWEALFKEDYTTERFTLMNKLIAAKINTYVTGNPTTDVASQFTNTAKMISDEMMGILMNYLKESSMENPTEFIHYKVPHFTPLHISFLNIMKKTVRVGKVVF